MSQEQRALLMSVIDSTRRLVDTYERDASIAPDAIELEVAYAAKFYDHLKVTLSSLISLE